MLTHSRWQSCRHHHIFSEIAEQDSDYLATGNTSFTTGKGTGVSKTNSFSVTAGIIVGMEQSVSLFGLFKTGLSAMTEVTGGAGYEKTSPDNKDIYNHL